MSRKIELNEALTLLDVNPADEDGEGAETERHVFFKHDAYTLTEARKMLSTAQEIGVSADHNGERKVNGFIAVPFTDTELAKGALALLSDDPAAILDLSVCDGDASKVLRVEASTERGEWTVSVRRLVFGRVTDTLWSAIGDTLSQAIATLRDELREV
jgi:hypothetical protein